MVDRSKTEIPATFPGAHWLATHQATVDNALAGSHVSRKVVSRGTNFYNEDHWPALRFGQTMTQWMQVQRRTEITKGVVKAWVTHANHKTIFQPRIVIAQTPAKLNTRLAHALVGGAYHEGWHTRDSRRTPLQPNILWDLVRQHKDRCPDWSRVTRLLEALFGIIEDIRIERRGIERMPSTRQALVDLQELIWAQEELGRLQELARGTEESDLFTPFGVLIWTIRDLGLGYNTQTFRDLMARRTHYQPEIVRVVRTVLKPHLLDCINMESSDDLGFLRKSLEIVGALQEHAELQEKPHDPSEDPNHSEKDSGQDAGDPNGHGEKPGESRVPREGGTAPGSGRSQDAGENSGEDGKPSRESPSESQSGSEKSDDSAKPDGKHEPGNQRSNADRKNTELSTRRDHSSSQGPSPVDRASDEPSEGNGNGSGASHGASQGSVAPQAASEVLESAKTDGAPLSGRGRSVGFRSYTQCSNTGVPLSSAT